MCLLLWEHPWRGRWRRRCNWEGPCRWGRRAAGGGRGEGVWEAASDDRLLSLAGRETTPPLGRRAFRMGCLRVRERALQQRTGSSEVVRQRTCKGGLSKEHDISSKCWATLPPRRRLHTLSSTHTWSLGPPPTLASPIRR